MKSYQHPSTLIEDLVEIYQAVSYAPFHETLRQDYQNHLDLLIKDIIQDTYNLSRLDTTRVFDQAVMDGDYVSRMVYELFPDKYAAMVEEEAEREANKL